MTLNKIGDNILKSNNDSNIYIIKDLKLAIDAGNKIYYKQFKQDLESEYNLKEIKTVILSHLHYDHIGCFTLFPNAKFYASDEVLEDFRSRKNDYILDAQITEEFTSELHPISTLCLPENYEIIPTPGHCSSCISVYDKATKTLFSGDTLFFNGLVGRADLPTSKKSQLLESLHKLEQIKIEKLCPGHDY